MYHYNQKSLENLNSCHPDLRTIFVSTLKIIDHSIICGSRSESRQNELYLGGFSQLYFPQSKHNKNPSHAVDAAPYPYPQIRVQNYEFYKGDEDIRYLIKKELWRCVYFAGMVMGVAGSLNIQLAWGGDWDIDNTLIDNKFDDLFHFELVR